MNPIIALTAVQSFSTVVLILVTIYYAYQTRATVREISKQRKDSMLPLVIAEEFNIGSENKKFKQDTYCVECSLKNIGNGPAFEIQVEFYDRETSEIVAVSEHSIDYIERGVSSKTHIHIPKKDFENIRYKEDSRGGLRSRLTAVVYFSNFNNDEYMVEQGFVIEKEIMNLQPIMGTFSFISLDKKTIDKEGKRMGGFMHYLFHRQHGDVKELGENVKSE